MRSLITKLLLIIIQIDHFESDILLLQMHRCRVFIVFMENVNKYQLFKKQQIIKFRGILTENQLFLN